MSGRVKAICFNTHWRAVAYTYTQPPNHLSTFMSGTRSWRHYGEHTAQTLRENVPSLKNGFKKITRVSDNEQGIFQATDDHLANVRRLQHWNDMISKAKK